ncbi:MAG: response regulator transcription factor [Chloroflexi bacterium]|nr:response regulator transcription factor [Chloroflexota bacterium]
MSSITANQNQSRNVTPPMRLTKRQKQCLQHVAIGTPHRAIAEQLGITERTVREHLSRARKKLDVHSTAEAVYVAVKLHILE